MRAEQPTDRGDRSIERQVSIQLAIGAVDYWLAHERTRPYDPRDHEVSEIRVLASRCRMEIVDLTSCDLEPIHAPGSIQPFVSLVAFKEGTSKIGWWSEDLPSHPLMGRAASHVSAMSPLSLFGASMDSSAHGSISTMVAATR